MSRRRRAERRQLSPDPKYNDVKLARFVTRVMMRGKKTVALRIVYGAFDEIQKNTGQNALEVFVQAVKNATPFLEVKPRRVGGATYQIPVEVEPNRGESLACRWILDAARARKGMPMTRKLALEISDAAKGEGAAVKRREDLRRMAEANRAFVHFRW